MATPPERLADGGNSGGHADTSEATRLTQSARPKGFNSMKSTKRRKTFGMRPGMHARCKPRVDSVRQMIENVYPMSSHRWW